MHLNEGDKRNSRQNTAGSLLKNERVIFLDALRFCGATSVVFQHFAEKSGGYGSYLVDRLSPGVFGVVLFFIVSGFVMPMASAKNFEWKSFVARRFFRIYPLVLFVFLIAIFFAYVLELSTFLPYKEFTFFEWCANFLLIQEYVGVKAVYGVTWTLSLEICWYALFLVLFSLLGNSFNEKLSVFFPVLISLVAVFSVLLDHRFPLGRLSMIYAAVLGCQFYRCFSGSISHRRMYFDIALFVCSTTVANVVSFGYFTHPFITLNQAVFPWIAAPVLFGLVSLNSFVRRSTLLNNKIVSWMARISFSTYLLHLMAWQIAQSYVGSHYVLYVSVLLTVILSTIGYYLIELPGQHIGRMIVQLWSPQKMGDGFEVGHEPQKQSAGL